MLLLLGAKKKTAFRMECSLCKGISCFLFEQIVQSLVDALAQLSQLVDLVVVFLDGKDARTDEFPE